MYIQDMQKINYALQNSECTFNKLQIQKFCIQDGFGEYDWSDLFLQLKLIRLENC